MFTVRHWKRGYKHDHTAKTKERAIGKCMRCAGHSVADGALKTMANLLVDRGWFEYMAPTGVEVYRLVKEE